MLRLVHLPLLACSYCSEVRRFCSLTLILIQNRKTKALIAAFPLLPTPTATSLSLLLFSPDKVYTSFCHVEFHQVELQMFVVRGWQWCPWDAEVAVWSWIRSLST